MLEFGFHSWGRKIPLHWHLKCNYGKRIHFKDLLPIHFGVRSWLSPFLHTHTHTHMHLDNGRDLAFFLQRGIKGHR